MLTNSGLASLYNQWEKAGLLCNMRGNMLATKTQILYGWLHMVAFIDRKDHRASHNTLNGDFTLTLTHTHTDAHFLGVRDKSVHTSDNLLKTGIGCISRFHIEKKRKFIISAACLPACGTLISHISLYVTCIPSHISTTCGKFTHSQ
jgi:hypothetical protein